MATVVCNVTIYCNIAIYSVGLSKRIALMVLREGRVQMG